VDWPYGVVLLLGLILIGLATWAVFRLGCSAEAPRAAGERGQQAQAEREPEDEIDRAG
jgi:hypothetical protein